MAEYSLAENGEPTAKENVGDKGVTGGDVVAVDVEDGEDCAEDAMERWSLERDRDFEMNGRDIGTEKALETRSEKVEVVFVLD